MNPPSLNASFHPNAFKASSRHSRLLSRSKNSDLPPQALPLTTILSPRSSHDFTSNPDLQELTEELQNPHQPAWRKRYLVPMWVLQALFLVLTEVFTVILALNHKPNPDYAHIKLFISLWLIIALLLFICLGIIFNEAVLYGAERLSAKKFLQMEVCKFGVIMVYQVLSVTFTTLGQQRTSAATLLRGLLISNSSLSPPFIASLVYAVVMYRKGRSATEYTRFGLDSIEEDDFEVPSVASE